MKKKQKRLTPFRVWIMIVGLFMVGGVIGGGLAFWKGLSVTNLTDIIPWGLWITIDLSAIALSAGAFMLSAAVYLLGLKQYQPLARTAVYVGLVGYSMAMMTLLLDIGRPDRFWHSIAFWNIHSPLWEVSMCLVLYFTVLILEVGPIFGETEWMRSRLPKLAGLLQRIHQFAPVLAIAGLALSLLHQSSLGASYGIMKARPIWYRPGMAVLFIASAMAAGPSMTVLASWIASKLTRHATVNEELLDGVSRFIGWVVVVFLYLRFWDTLAMSYTFEPGRSEALRVLTRGQLSFNFWIGEILFGLAIPAVILLSNKLRRIQPLRAMALLFVIGGLVAFRWDSNVVGLMVSTTIIPQDLTPLYVSYQPSIVEWAAGLGVIAYGFMAFTLGVKYLKVVDKNGGHLQAQHALQHAPVSASAGSD